MIRSIPPAFLFLPTVRIVPAPPPRHVEPCQPSPPPDCAPARADCPANLLDHLPGSVPFDTHLRLENRREELIQRQPAPDRPTPTQPSLASPNDRRRSNTPRLADVSPTESLNVQRRLVITYRHERRLRAGLVIDLLA